MSTDHIRYDLLTQDALRGMVRRVLADTARVGLPGEHHFFISFKTQYPGVSIPVRLAEKFPEEITIVLQHQFWDLTVSDYGFEVGLSFGNAPERLVVPFDAVTAFFDPSVEFGVKFEVADIEAEAGEEVAASPATATVRSVPRAKSSAAEGASEGSAKPGRKNRSKAEAPPKEEEEQEPPKVDGDEKIVSLDHFRKKK